MKHNLPIPIEEHYFPKPEETVERIFKASHETKQRWFGLKNSGIENFDPELLNTEISNRIILDETAYRKYIELTPYFKEKIQNEYFTFENYNKKIILALKSGLTNN